MHVASTQRTGKNWPALVPVGYALMVTLYVLLRYGGRWAEQDTSQFDDMTRRLIDQGTISPTGGAYPHGYGYQTILANLSLVTGIDADRLQIFFMPFLSLVVALAAFVAFRALTGSPTMGAIAGLLLFIQPEFLFVLQRGNHEKVTQMLVLLLVLMLAVTLTRPLSLGTVFASILCFYAMDWALISTNSFFASSFMGSLGLSLVGGLVALWVLEAPSGERHTVRRLAYTVASCFALLFAFVVYIYKPAGHNFAIFRGLIDRLSLLFLNVEPAGNPYGVVAAAWAAPWVYPVLTAFNWLVIAGSAAAWIWLGIRFFRNGVPPNQRHWLLLWLLAAAFAFEVLIALVVDFAGFLAENLQIRVFPLFMLFGIPLVVLGATHLTTRVRWPIVRGVGAVALAGALTLFAAAGVLKATNDPLVSNKWLFFTRSEQEALGWVDQHLEHQQVWFGFDERLRSMQIMHQPADAQRGNRYEIGRIEGATRYITMSDVIERRSRRLGLPPPDTRAADRVYDNGGAQIYHRVPATPYQP